MRAAARNQLILTVSEVPQGNQESPVGFPDHLQEVYWVFTRIDLTAAEKHQAVYIDLVI